MNPILTILLFIAAFILWILCSALYRPIGKIANRLLKDAKDAMLEEEKEKEK